jgi:hypothetical protein
MAASRPTTDNNSIVPQDDPDAGREQGAALFLLT